MTDVAQLVVQVLILVAVIRQGRAIRRNQRTQTERLAR